MLAVDVPQCLFSQPELHKIPRREGMSQKHITCCASLDECLSYSFLAVSVAALIEQEMT